VEPPKIAATSAPLSWAGLAGRFRGDVQGPRI